MIAVIAAAFAMICTSAASSADMVLANRCANAAQSLLSLKCTLAATSASRAVVPDLVYRENKALYLMLKPSVASPRRAPPAVTLSGGTRSVASAPAAMADIRTRGRRGCGLKGKRTKRMVEQLAKFTKWLHDNPINEHVPSRTVGARSNQFWLLNEKTFKRDAARTGRKRGFSSAKTLASAFRNSKA